MHVLYEGALDMPTRLCYDNVTGGIKPPHKILLDYTTILVFTQNSGNSLMLLIFSSFAAVYKPVKRIKTMAITDTINEL